MCRSFIAGVTKLPISQIYKFSFLKYIITLVTCKAGVMPELSSEGKANSSDGLNHTIYEGNYVDLSLISLPLHKYHTCSGWCPSSKTCRRRHCPWIFLYSRQNIASSLHAMSELARRWSSSLHHLR